MYITYNIPLRVKFQMFAKLKMATLSACLITILVIAIVDVRSLRLTGTNSNIAGEEGTVYIM